jgi:hypothetical protein
MYTSRLLGAVCGCLFFSAVSISQASSIITTDGRYIDTIAYAYGGNYSNDGYLRDQRISDGSNSTYDVSATLTATSTCDPQYDTGCNSLGDTAAQANASATLTSTVAPLLFTAAGSAAASGSADANNPSAGYYATASARYAVAFTLDSTYQYSFSGILDNPTNTLGSESAYVQFITNGSGSIIYDHFDVTGSFSSSGVLLPGDYYVEGIAYSFDATGYSNPTLPGSFELTLTLTEVPIPPAVLLFSSGVLGLIGVGRQKQIA